MQKNQKQIASTIPSVSELTAQLKQVVEQNFPEIMVEGEISNANTSRSGHTYFTLKDENAQLPCVLWNSTARHRNITVKDGQKVVAGGDIEVYPPHGKYQLIVKFLQSSGKGALQQAFEALKRKLKEEGLFDSSTKKNLPAFPFRIGVITSETGAAFHDISTTLAKRWPPANLYLYHSSVQGDRAAPQIVEGIEYFSNRTDIDLLIVGRGGGSLEDLWPFNEETVARALHRCRLPTVSAVGHEVDFSISDFVADKRAATPTQAALLVAPDINEIRYQIDDYISKLELNIDRKIDRNRENVERLLTSHALRIIRRRVDRYTDRVGAHRDRLTHALEINRRNAREKLKDLSHRLQTMDPNQALKQGFTRVLQEGTWIKKAHAFNPEKSYTLEWADKKIKID